MQLSVRDGALRPPARTMGRDPKPDGRTVPSLANRGERALAGEAHLRQGIRAAPSTAEFEVHESGDIRKDA
jgi:hypothetical protein